MGVPDVFEFGVGFVEGIDEVLYLSHLELSDADEAVSWGYLVAETEADLGSCEGDSATVELSQFVEVEEHTLGGLGAEIADKVGGGTYFCFEHEVERLGRG